MLSGITASQYAIAFNYRTDLIDQFQSLRASSVLLLITKQQASIILIMIDFVEINCHHKSIKANCRRMRQPSASIS
jgi:hypothetical protein